MMNRVPSRRTKILVRVGIVILVFLAIILFLLFWLGLISGRIPYAPTMIVLTLFMGGDWLFVGIKKLREKRRNGRRVSWYTQPAILLALATLLWLPSFILNVVINDAFPGRDILIIVLLIPSILLFFASAFFFFKTDEPIF